MDSSTSEYYEALVDSYMSTILESGLLLDEDLQVILRYYKTDNWAVFPKYKPCLPLNLSVSTLLGSLFLFRKVNKVLLLPPIIATGIAVIFEIKNCKKRKFEQILMQNIVNISKKINTLNTSIRRYIKTRLEINNKSQHNLFSGYNKQIDLFFSDIFLSEIRFYQTVKETVEIFSDLSDELTDDYNSVKYFQPYNDLLEINDLQTGLDFLNKVQDVHIWITSKLFSYVSITFYCPNRVLTEKVFDQMLDVELYSLLKFLVQHYELTNKRFFTLRNTVAKVNELKAKKPEFQLSNKLHKTLLSAIDNLSFISEKSNTIISEIENSKGRLTETLQIAIIDLRYHTFAAYESIDLLCRLYGILSTQQETSENVLPYSKTNKSQDQDSTLPTINHDDLVNVPEENFELYLEKDSTEAIGDTNTYKEDNSGAYLSLMLQELKQSLGKHERFIEARKRRGSIDKEPVEKKKTEIPKFDLNALKCSKGTDVIDLPPSDEFEIHETISCCSCPLPPPLPRSNKVFKLQDMPSEEDCCKSMFEGIKILSNQLGLREEVFGEFVDAREGE